MLNGLKAATRPVRRKLAGAIYTLAEPPEHLALGTMSFSGGGEDVIVLSWLRQLAIDVKTVRYLDIGAAEPVRLSNTYLLSLHGASGVLVEPDPDQAAVLRSARPGDIVLNVGVAFDERRRASLTRLSHRVFNSFSEDQVEAVLRQSETWSEQDRQSIVDRIEVDLVPIDRIIEEHFGRAAPDFLSIDTERCDLAILKSLDLGRFLPTIICIEATAPAMECEALLKPRGYHLMCYTTDNLLFMRHPVIDSFR